MDGRTHAHSHARMHTCMLSHMLTHTRAHTHAHVHKCMLAHSHTHAHSHAQMNTCTHAHSHMHAHMHTHTHTCSHAHTHARTHARSHALSDRCVSWKDGDNSACTPGSRSGCSPVLGTLVVDWDPGPCHWTLRSGLRPPPGGGEGVLEVPVRILIWLQMDLGSKTGSATYSL